MIDLDFGGVSNEKPQLYVEAGVYHARVTDLKQLAAKSEDKKPTLRIDLVVNNEEGNEIKIMDFIYLDKSFLWKARQFFEALTGEEQTGSISISEQEAIGAEVRVQLSVREESYKDKDGNQRNITKNVVEAYEKVAF